MKSEKMHDKYDKEAMLVFRCVRDNKFVNRASRSAALTLAAEAVRRSRRALAATEIRDATAKKAVAIALEPYQKAMETPFPKDLFDELVNEFRNEFTETELLEAYDRAAALGLKEAVLRALRQTLPDELEAALRPALALHSAQH